MITKWTSEQLQLITAIDIVIWAEYTDDGTEEFALNNKNNKNLGSLKYLHDTRATTDES